MRVFGLSTRAWPPEQSIALRVAATGAVCAGIAACQTQGELPLWYAVVTACAVVAGNSFSHLRRHRSLPQLKVVLGATMVGAFAWFFVTVSSEASAGRLVTLEAPLAVLFTAMQAAHAFDVPSRRDLGFSLAGSAALVTVAAAQAVDLGFGVVVVVWAAFVVTGLAAAWVSMAGGARVRPLGIALALVSAVVVGAALILFLPAPAAPRLPAAAAGTDISGQPSRLVAAGAGALQQSQAASGLTGVGGPLGLAGPLDTAGRESLGDDIVLRVRAQQPSFWIAETLDHWSGQSWTETARGSGGSYILGGGPPFVVTGMVDDRPVGAPLPGAHGVRAKPGTLITHGSADYQTFYLAQGASDLVLHASQPVAVWFPASHLSVSADGTIKTSTAFGAGSVYTVLSTVETPSPAQLRSVAGSSPSTGLTPAVATQDLELPHPYPRVSALARRVSADEATTYGKVTALEHWIGTHTRYTTAIAPLTAAQDTVTQFLFVTRRGYCEQISTSLAVMLRSLGIPAREAVGYVPGSYDPITGLYDVEARDAHAWVQVWFPGFGWESFDPTAYVPLATPSPAGAFGHELAAAVHRIPVLPTALGAAGLLCVSLLVEWRRRRPRTWRASVTKELERAARRTAPGVGPGDTLGSVAAQVDAALKGRSPVRAMELADAAERAAWCGADPDRRTARRHVRDARRVRRAAAHASRRVRAAPGSRGSKPGPGH